MSADHDTAGVLTEAEGAHLERVVRAVVVEWLNRDRAEREGGIEHDQDGAQTKPLARKIAANLRPSLTADFNRILAARLAAQAVVPDVSDLIHAVENADPTLCGACGETYTAGHFCEAIRRAYEQGLDHGHQHLRSRVETALQDSTTDVLITAGHSEHRMVSADLIRAALAEPTPGTGV